MVSWTVVNARYVKCITRSGVVMLRSRYSHLYKHTADIRIVDDTDRVSSISQLLTTYGPSTVYSLFIRFMCLLIILQSLSIYDLLLFVSFPNPSITSFTVKLGPKKMFGTSGGSHIPHLPTEESNIK